MDKTIGQKIAYVVAWLCYLAGVACIAASILYDSPLPSDPIRASLIASVVFFAGCGVVLHVIATTRLKGLISTPAGSKKLPAEN